MVNKGRREKMIFFISKVKHNQIAIEIVPHVRFGKALQSIDIEADEILDFLH